MAELSQQVVLVTGASRGLGAEIAKSFARQGCSVVVNFFNSEAAAAAVVAAIAAEGKGKAVALKADVRVKAEVEDLFRAAADHFGTPITVVVNNALVNFRFDPTTQKSAEAISWEEYSGQMEGTLKAALNTLQAALPAFKKAGGGRVINIGTNLFQHPVVPYHEYTAAKGALLAFTRNMARELGQYGVTVNMVSGGLLRTTDASAVTTPEVFAIIEATTPLKRVTTPQEMADAVLFFASPWSRGVTGQNLVVDGGLVMN